MLLKDIFLQSPDNVPKFGVEIELEGISVSQAQSLGLSRYWAAKADGSLRPHDNSVELVFNQGFDLDQSHAALSLLDANLPDYSTSIRTSIHVHLDVSSIDSSNFKALILNACLIDDGLFHYFGKSRKNWLYCRPIDQHKLTLLKEVCESMERGSTTRARNLLREYPKYSSINFKPLLALGTIEFRHFQVPERGSLYHTLYSITRILQSFWDFSYRGEELSSRGFRFSYADYSPNMISHIAKDLYDSVFIDEQSSRDSDDIAMYEVEEISDEDGIEGTLHDHIGWPEHGGIFNTTPPSLRTLLSNSLR